MARRPKAPALTIGQRAVLSQLCQAKFTGSIDDLARRTGITSRNAWYAVVGLSEAGYIEASRTVTGSVHLSVTSPGRALNRHHRNKYPRSGYVVKFA